MVENQKNNNSWPWRRLLQAAFLAWTLEALLMSVRYCVYQLTKGHPVQWWHIFFFNFNAAILWVLFTPLLAYCSSRILSHFSHWYQRVFVHLALGIVVAPLHTILFLGLDFALQNALGLWTQAMPFHVYFNAYFLELLLEAFLAYIVVSGLLTGYLFYLSNQKAVRKQEELEKNLIQSQLTNLKYQLQPHFLFNSMQTISNLMHKDVQVADHAIGNLSDILRFSIQHIQTDFINLREEVELTKKYLEFQQLRFEDKIRYSLAVQEELSMFQVPTLLLQPLVENAIKHGFEQTGKPVFIEIKIRQEAERLLLGIVDDGPGFKAVHAIKKQGAGIKNLLNRLDYFYPDNYTFKILDVAKGSHICINLPIYQSNGDI